MRAKDGRSKVGHYLRERAAPGGRAVAWGSVRVRWVTGRGCCGNDLIDARSPRKSGEEKRKSRKRQENAASSHLKKLAFEENKNSD